MSLRALALGMFLAIGIASSGQAQQATDEAAVKKLTALDRQFETLFSNGDVETLGLWIDKFMSNDFSCVLTDGNLVTTKAVERAHLLEQAKRGIKLETTDLKIRTTGDTGIATALTHVHARSATGQTRDFRYRRMNVWVREHGDWKWASCSGALVPLSH